MRRKILKKLEFVRLSYGEFNLPEERDVLWKKGREKVDYIGHYGKKACKISV